MKLLHTNEEIKYLEDQRALASELTVLNNKHNNTIIKELIKSIISIDKTELNKYNHLIGTTCYAPISILGSTDQYRKGTIEEITHFNNYSKSIRVKFRYDKSTGGGFDGHSLLKLKETL